MADPTIVERAEKLGRRRARLLPALALIYISQQFTYFWQVERAGDALRTVDIVTISAWLVLTLVLMMGLSRFAFPFHRKDVRALLDDETTRANRHEALIAGFWAICWSAIALYVFSLFEPLDGRTALHLLLSAGIGVALLRFGRLELGAHGSA